MGPRAPAGALRPRSSSAGWRIEGPPGGPWATTRRSPEARPAGGAPQPRLPSKYPEGPDEKTSFLPARSLRRAAGAVPFSSWSSSGRPTNAKAIAGGPAVDPTVLFHRVLPPNTSRGSDRLPGGGEADGSPQQPGRSRCTPAPSRFSTRLLRGAHLAQRRHDVSPGDALRHFVLNWLARKERDIAMSSVTVFCSGEYPLSRCHDRVGPALERVIPRSAPVQRGRCASAGVRFSIRCSTDLR